MVIGCISNMFDVKFNAELVKFLAPVARTIIPYDSFWNAKVRKMFCKASSTNFVLSPLSCFAGKHENRSTMVIKVQS